MKKKDTVVTFIEHIMKKKDTVVTFIEHINKIINENKTDLYTKEMSDMSRKYLKENIEHLHLVLCIYKKEKRS